MKNRDKRDFIVNHLKQFLIGPGADVFGGEHENELFSSYPLQSYYSAILFPERSIPKSLGVEDEINIHADIISEEERLLDSETMEKQLNEKNEFGHELKALKKEKVDFYKSVNSYFPTNCGLTFCVDKEVNFIEVEFKAGIYRQPQSLKEIKVLIGKEDYHSFINLHGFPFEEYLTTEEKDDKHYWLSLSKPLGHDVKASKQEIKNYKTTLKNLDLPIYHIGFKKLDLLTSGVFFKRSSLEEKLTLDISSNSKETVFDTEKSKAICYTKVIVKEQKKYVKILLKNESAKHPMNKFSYSNELLNEKALFQVEIKVNAPILPYKDEIIENPYDREATIVNYQYRELKSYGIGHGTAVFWDKSERPQWIKTEFAPKVGVRSVSNGFRKNEKDLEKIADIKNLSIWTKWQPSQLCENLEIFINAYKNWITQQKQKANNEGSFKDISDEIIQKQIQNYNRLQRNVDLLRQNNKVYDAFLLANTAMYIQLVISIDNRFGKKEKELYEFSKEYKNVDYKSLSFFESYSPKRPIAYRPFQLAFLLLNLEAIVNEDISERNDLVDLLWFPTGGGKTEAYLAVTAFTILWRRINFPHNCGGVSVIMRYTLRLLTAQQFERASRLIVALEFMNKRQQELPATALYQKPKIGNKQNPISIGMWVGGGTTPNSIEDAILELNGSDEKSLGRKIQKLNEQNPKPKNADSIDNIFQVSACPWCGCKTITKNEKDIFVHAFNALRGGFNIECKNSKCDFSRSLPIDIIDDSLYSNPPTLLFATVDKFAQLSHREEGHRFFNSLDQTKLPPDLIIQDELHLLNGPLGSIVGLFELMVERLCTKNGRKPKIIASTATTRNTQQQVANLYGNRAVNIFPPLGITYDDNYFSFTDSENNDQRLHVGFMPTGKTAVDSQVRAMLPQLLFARILLYRKLKLNDEEIDNYWTIVSYYNSLKDVGKTYNKVNDEIITVLKRLHEQHDLDRLQYNFNNRWLMDRTRELTSRIESTKIKSYLNELFASFKTEINEDYRNLKSDVISLVLASNMLSVGIDVPRLNIMLMNGQPKNTAEYIQASSRVARKFDGLVVNLLDANRAREKSYFENFIPFHNAYYKFVEPLTVTPFTNITFDKVLNSLLVCFVRHIKGLNKNKEAHDFQKKYADKFIKLMEGRVPESEKRKLKIIEEYVDELQEDWLEKINSKRQLGERLTYKKGLIADSQEYVTSEEVRFALMNSMREIDTNSVIDVNIYKTLKPNFSDETK